MDRRLERATAAAISAWILAGFGSSAFAGGHLIAHYPSYYPDEIRVETVDPKVAATRLGDGTLHAYVGAVPAFVGPPPRHAKPFASLRSFVVLDIAAAPGRFATAEARCAAARVAIAGMAGAKAAGFVFHPYPVTPYHADYLHHADRAKAAKDSVGAAPAVGPKVRAGGPLAEAIVGPGHPAAAIALAEVPLSDLLAGSASWSGPPWIKEGWFQAYRLLAPVLAGETRRAADEIHGRLVRGDVADLAEQTNLERRLIAALNADCRRLVVGYTTRTEFINEAFPPGIENVVPDSHGGLGAPVFIRTVKLKEYPWHGSLGLGTRDRPQAAWNPIAGFDDAAGRLVWAALGDPAMIAYPDNSGWVPNRVQFTVDKVRGQSGGMPIPPDALRPQAGLGALAPVGPGAFASAKVTYDVLASPYLDGTEPDLADLIYPFSFVYRWGSKADAAGTAREPRLAPALAVLGDRLAGFKPVRVDRTVKSIALGIDVVRKTPVFEVYLRDAPGDENQVAALAPPWSTLPWHLLALMEEAVVRGYAAFSKEEARRRGVPWLDLVRDGLLLAKMAALVAEFERDGFRPEVLKKWVGAEDARHRWRALGAFAKNSGHFLVTNGPYRLKSWTSDGAVLSAVREATYPLGFGTFDRFVNPPRAAIRDATREASGFAVAVDADITVRAGRYHKIERQPLTRATAQGTHGVFVASRHLLIGPDGAVIRAGPMAWEKDNRFNIPIPNGLTPGRHTVALGVFLDGNALDLSIRLLPFDVGR